MEYMDLREEHESLFYNRSGRRLNTMYISRMMKKYCEKAGIPAYSAEAVRNCCAFNLFAYGASSGQTAAQMGRTEQQIRRYRGTGYKNNLRSRRIVWSECGLKSRDRGLSRRLPGLTSIF